MQLRFVVQIAPGNTALSMGCALLGIDIDALHQRQIEHNAAVAGGITGGIMTAATHSQEDIVLASEVHGGDDISRARASHNQSRLFVDHLVPNEPDFVVSGGLSRENGAAHS